MESLFNEEVKVVQKHYNNGVMIALLLYKEVFCIEYDKICFKNKFCLHSLC